MISRINPIGYTNRFVRNEYGGLTGRMKGSVGVNKIGSNDSVERAETDHLLEKRERVD